MNALDDLSDAAHSRFVALTAALGAIGFIVAFEIVNWLASQHVYGSLHDALDVRLYQFYGREVLAGSIPYRGFAMEYPPFALPAFVIPAIVTGGTPDADAYRAAFQAAMLGCGVLAVAVVVATVGRLTERRADIAAAAAFLAVTPLLMGPVILARYDLWPALLTAVAMAAAIAARYRWAAVFLALGIAAKVYPVVLVPLLGVYVWRRVGRREALLCGAIGAAVVAAVLVPFLLVATSGTLDALARAIERPLQVESLGGATLFVLHGVAGLELERVFSFGSDNLQGPLASGLAAIQTVAVVASLAWIWVRFARATTEPAQAAAEPVRLAIAAAAAICAYVALGKVLSDNYVTWLVPLVVLVPGRRGRIELLLLGGVLLLTSFIYPIHYADYVDSRDLGVATVVLLRVFGILALAGYLAVRLERDGPASRQPAQRGSQPAERP